MATQSETLAFMLSDGDLKAALDLLRGRTKDAFRELWILLTVELERRRLKAPPVELRVSREGFAALPPDVQELLNTASHSKPR